MKIRLTDNTELNLIMVTGASRYVQGANRDCLSFVFDDTVSMDEMDAIFTEANCESIIIVGDDGSEAVYKDYTIRAELKKSVETAENETPDAPTETVNRIYVSMVQRNYAEKMLMVLSNESTNTQLAVAELAEIVVGGC